MAYNNSAPRGGYSNSRPQTAAPVKASAPAQAQAGGQREFVEDPNKVGIGYEKEMKTGGKYIAVTVTKDIPEGTKLFVYLNDKVKNRTEKTPTHVLKLPKVKPE